MDKTTVYRVERRDGAGPYDSLTMLGLIDAAQFYGPMDIRPGPDRDGIPLPNAYYVCGFRNLTQAHNWFAGAFDFLYQQSYYLSEYKVPCDHVLFGRKQVAFDRYKAERLRMFQLGELETLMFVPAGAD